MKRSLSLLAIVAAIFFIGCSKKNNDSRNIPGSMTVLAAGTTTNTANCRITSTGNFYSILAAWGPVSTMVINIKTSNSAPTSLATTTYVIDSTRENNTADYTPGGIVYPAKSGTVTITNIKPGISTTGTFNLIVQGGYVVTGSFTAVAAQ